MSLTAASYLPKAGGQLCSKGWPLSPTCRDEADAAMPLTLTASGNNSSATITLTESGSTLTVSDVSGASSYKVAASYTSNNSATFDILSESTPNAIAAGMEFTRRN